MKKENIIKISLIVLTFIVFATAPRIWFFYRSKEKEKSKVKMVQNYKLHSEIKKNNEKIDNEAKINLDNDGTFDYDLDCTFQGEDKEFKVLLLVDYIPQVFSIDGKEFSKEQYLLFEDGDSKHNFKLRDKINKSGIVSFLFIPTKIKEDPVEFNCIPCMNANIILLNGRLSEQDKEIIKLKGEKVLEDEDEEEDDDDDETNFSFRLNSELSNGRLIKKDTVIKCKTNESIDIPICAKSEGSTLCNYCIFLDDELIKFNNFFSKTIQVEDGNAFTDNITITTPNKSGKYTIWGLISRDIYKDDVLSRSTSSENYIELEVE